MIEDLMPKPNWTHGPASGWTQEQAANAARWLCCMTCGAPREHRMTEMMENGRKVVTLGIVCPNGHPQN